MNLENAMFMTGFLVVLILGFGIPVFQSVNVSVLKGEVVSVSQPFSTYDSNYRAHVVVHIDYLHRNVTVDVHCDSLQEGSNVQIQYVPTTLFLSERFVFIGLPYGC